MSARAWSARRYKFIHPEDGVWVEQPLSVAVQARLDELLGPPSRRVPALAWRPYNRAELTRCRRMATQQRRLDRRYDRHERHRTCPRGTLAVTITADVSQFMEALGIALEAWQAHMLERALVGTDAVTQPLRGLL